MTAAVRAAGRSGIAGVAPEAADAGAEMGSMVAVGKAAGAEEASGAVLGRWLAGLFTLLSSPIKNNKARVGDTHRK